MRITSGVARRPPRPARTPPRAVPSADPVVPSGEPERSKIGRFCRDRQSPAGRSVCSRIVRQATAVSLASAGPDDVQARDRAQRGEVLDRLVGRAVLAEADRVVRPDVGDRQLHQRGQPDRAAHVVGEDQERAAVDAGAAVQRDAVHDRAHARARGRRSAACGRTGPPGHILVWRSVGRNDGSPFDRGVVALGEVGRAAPQLGQHRLERGQHLAGRLAGGDALRVGVEARQLLGPAGGQRSGLHSRSSSCRRSRRWPPPRRRSASATRRAASWPRVDDLAGVLEHLGGDLEGLRPGRSRGPAWSPRPRRRRAPSRAPCRCSACSAPARR